MLDAYTSRSSKPSYDPVFDATQTYTQTYEDELHLRIKQKNYPCVAARAAIARNEYRIKVYHGLGTGEQAVQLGRDLLEFKREQEATGSKYLSFIAIFPELQFETEGRFEEALWNELSAVVAEPEFDGPWDPNFSSDPKDKNFCFSLGGSAFFVVGMHPESSRISRQFSVPAIVFNLYQQFEMLDEETEFYPMVETNRKRDELFQGSVNPMVKEYAEKWEAIQFSGRDNPPEWKCPFKRTMKALRLQ